MTLHKLWAATSMIDRLCDLKEPAVPIVILSSDLGRAFEFLMSVGVRHQFEQLQNGMSPDNFIDPDGLDMKERRTLLE